MDAAAAFEAFEARLERLDTLRGVRALAAWDQQTGLPAAAAATRSRQLAWLGQLEHAELVDPELRRLLDALRDSDQGVHQRAAVVLGREVDRAARVPAGLVGALSEARSAAFGAWVAAKESDDFATFAPHLQRLRDLTLEQLAAIDPDRHPYDVALEDYDPGTTMATLEPLFARLREGLVALLDAIGGAAPIPVRPLAVPVPVQRALHHEIAAALGYDFQAGRLDEAAHPFTIDLGPGDVRITTFYDPDDLFAGLGGTIHEVGHALYEQGLPREVLGGTGLDRAASMGLHESQSRFWENAIGRSEPFCDWLAGRLRAQLGAEAPSAEALYRQLNRVERSLIRIFADEVTYDLHIIVRFELEVALLEGRLAVADLPEAWNAAYQATLGIRPPDDRQGCLQDVHWSHGAFGYFPSYTLGNLYAASWAATLREQVPDLDGHLREGTFGPVLAWLREHVHRHGALLDAPELVRRECGDRDLVADLLDHLWARHGVLYGVTRG
jgi:carboxypeptidase Taq